MDEKQRFALKKKIKEISEKKARHTELVSVYIPAGFHIQKVIDQMVLVSDIQMQKAMKFMSVNCKLILEPAGVATIAALQGPLKNKLKNETTVVILCGANIDMNSWNNLTNIH